MSPRKAAPVPTSAIHHSRPLQASMTLVAVVLLILLSCIDFSTSTTLPSSASQELPMASHNEKLAEDALPPLDKQPVKRAASRQYNFGLGKRGEESPSEEDLTELLRKKEALLAWYNMLSQLADTRNSKRSRPQRFGFGIGKRVMEQVDEQESEPQPGPQALALVQEDTGAESGFGVDKRKVERYQFGIGKRSWFAPANSAPGSHKKVANFEDFMKRRYSFGLGKRST